ncbi:Gfo/Idh/MocA family oxidoreductase [Micromonospora sp. RHAY321]|uniref:Gfo/Idh/MocA family protein n=1 Tax=Micromonospora sp. RHAY321 TaxID=2944807 RepID=UPI00207C41C6|nr:Gfo/Idh/MocA family oxidoreductase [Micromonospora sp. RHAY321]MCO1597096.1 Gfo/Idh/MocA family oxidoreductase [Micromonospora sp. RHAY321]
MSVRGRSAFRRVGEPNPRRGCLLVGLGDRSQRVLLPALARCGIGVVDVVDTSPQRLDAFRAAQAAGWVAPEARFLPGLPAVAERYDFALVAVPHGAHERTTRHLTQLGCPVLKEKPYARDLSHARRLYRDAADLLHPLVDRPFLPVFRLLARLLPRLGPAVRYRARYWRPSASYRQTWRNDPEMAGDGVISDMGYHCLDLVLRLLGRPTLLTVTDIARRPGYLVDEQVRLGCVHRDGSRGTMEISRLAEVADERYIFVGNGAVIRAGLSYLQMRLPGGASRSWRFSYDPVSAASHTIGSAVADLASRRRARWENRHGLRVMAAIADAYRTDAVGQLVREDEPGVSRNA